MDPPANPPKRHKREWEQIRLERKFVDRMRVFAEEAGQKLFETIQRRAGQNDHIEFDESFLSLMKKFAKIDQRSLKDTIQILALHGIQRRHLIPGNVWKKKNQN